MMVCNGIIAIAKVMLMTEVIMFIVAIECVNNDGGRIGKGGCDGGYGSEIVHSAVV